jgi:hypothetical protein
MARTSGGDGDDQEQLDPSDAAEDVLDEQAVRQEIVPFMGDELAAALTPGGNIYITFPAMCTALGLSVRGQTQRVQRTRTLSGALRRIPIETRGGRQRINCLRVDMVALWLAGVQTSQIRPQFRAKIETYQEQLAPVATQVFLRVAGLRTADLVPAGDPRVEALSAQIDELSDVVDMLRDHLAALATAEQVAGLSLRLDQALALLGSLAERQEATEEQVVRIDERTQRLTPAHAQAVREVVDRLVTETAHLSVPLTYPMVYGRLKRRFRANSYREVADDRFDELMAYLRDELQRATDGQASTQGTLF